MKEYEQTQTVGCPADEVFAWLSNVENLPKYLPPITEAHLEGEAAEGSPGEQVSLKGEIPDQGSFESEGYFDVDEATKTLRWGAESHRHYSGELSVTPAGENRSEVRARLSFGEDTAEPQIQEQSADDRDPLEEGVAATLESIRRQIEEGSGKVEQPSPQD